jgi:hypothetical protein
MAFRLFLDCDTLPHTLRELLLTVGNHNLLAGGKNLTTSDTLFRAF